MHSDHNRLLGISFEVFSYWFPSCWGFIGNWKLQALFTGSDPYFPSISEGVVADSHDFLPRKVDKSNCNIIIFIIFTCYNIFFVTACELVKIKFITKIGTNFFDPNLFL